MPEVFTHTDPIIEVGDDWLQRLKRAASESPLRRSRLCLHLTPEDAIQEMVIVLCQDVLFRPHRHMRKTESFHVIEGVLDILVFDDAGEIVRAVHMGPSGIAPTLCYRLNASLYHALLPRTPYVVFHETTAGPFRKDEAQFAPWAPDEPAELRGFLEGKLRRFRTETGMRHEQVQRS